jgi:hypothetical protein
MKRKIRITVIAALLILPAVCSFAQQPPHPNGGNVPGSGNGPVGGGAAIGSGLYILIAMGAAYGLRRYYQYKNINTVAEYK